ncbi:MAG: YybH family protein [Limnohabitans sp.]
MQLLVFVMAAGLAFIVMFPKESMLDEWTWQSPVEPPGVTILSHEPQVLTQPVAKPPALAAASSKQPNASVGPSSTASTALANLTPAEMSANDHAQIRKALELWSAAWSSRNMDAYFDQYAKSFVPAGGQSRSAWERMRRQRILSKSQITHEIRDLQITVQGDQATANFEQLYATDQTRLVGPKTLRLQREGLGWRIISESTN